jgi:hypothetical protein
MSTRQATWNRAQIGSLWGEPGCQQVGTDRRASPESSVTVNGLDEWYTFDLTNLVQDWVGGQLANNGVLLRADSGVGFYAFTSCDGSTISRRPKLVVTYVAGGVPPTPTSTATQTPTGTRTPSPTAPAPIPTQTSTATPTASPSVTPTATAVSPGAEITVTLQQGKDGYTGSQDTYMYQYAPAENYCGQPQLKVGYRQQNAALIQFALSSIPSDATVTRATLQLYAAGWGGADATLGAYAVRRDVTICQANWNQARFGNPWALPGCNNTLTDRREFPESEVQTAGIGQWYSLDLTTLVQDWVNGSLVNNGVLLRADYSNSVFYLSSAEAATTSQRPKLIVTYHP